MAIEIVDLPIKNGGSFHSYVSLPEGKGNNVPMPSPVKPPFWWLEIGGLCGWLQHIGTSPAFQRPS